MGKEEILKEYGFNTLYIKYLYASDGEHYVPIMISKMEFDMVDENGLRDLLKSRMEVAETSMKNMGLKQDGTNQRRAFGVRGGMGASTR